MQLIAITGSIASGKSTFLKVCGRKGAAIINSDEMVHDLLANDQQIIQKVAALFPTTLSTDGRINRNELAKIVFNDQAQLKKLEKILHPAVRQEIIKWSKIQKKRGKKWAAIEVPLLFESGMQDLFDTVVVTRTSLPEIKRRALKRPGMTEQKLRTILARQWPQAKKARLADQIINTGIHQR